MLVVSAGLLLWAVASIELVDLGLDFGEYGGESSLSTFSDLIECFSDFAELCPLILALGLLVWVTLSSSVRHFTIS